MCQTSLSDMSQSWIFCKMIVASWKRNEVQILLPTPTKHSISAYLIWMCMDLYRFDMICAWRQDVSSSGVKTILYSDVGLKAWHSWLSDFCWCANCSKDSCNTSWLRMLQDSAEYSVRQSCQLHFSCRTDKGWRIWNPNVHQARSGTFETEQFEKGWAV